MSFLMYAAWIFGAVFYVLVLLTLYSLLVMAQRGDACLDRLEMEMLKQYRGKPIQSILH